MNANRIFPFVIVIAIVILSACVSSSNPNPPAAQPPAVATNASTPTTEVQPEVQVNEAPANTSGPSESPHACDNPYLPIVLGATWNYKLTGPLPDTFTHTILSMESNSFVEQDVFNAGVTRQGTWNCENGNLIALDPPGGASANVSTENNVAVDFETKDLSGVTLPAAINVGDTWSQSLTLEGTQTINGTAYPASNQLTSNCKAIGLESVTVEAGTFDALRVECQTTMKLSLKLGDTPTENTINLTGTNWYVRDVGLVKTLTIGFGVDSTVELLSYNIP
ncbi:MAG TPA: hypothetical protein VFQ13_06040 [Anaerolineales bacterium]|nr:hypothetical protein [Anaerolineales bacterium]